jgi:acyl carrier protein
MRIETIRDKLCTFILEHFPLARKMGIAGDLPLLQSGIIDSLGILELVEFMEREFAIVIADEELAPDNFQNLEVLSKFVLSKRNGGAKDSSPVLGAAL